MQLSEEQHRAVSAAVGAAETGTDGEIVTIVADLSDHYQDIASRWAAAIALLFLIALPIAPRFWRGAMDLLSSGWSQDYTPAAFLTAIAATAVFLYFVATLMLENMPLRLFLTPSRVKEDRVRARAVRLFRVGTESRTDGRTGILVYLSTMEHRAEIVADSAIAEKVDAARWAEAMGALIDGVKQGRPGDGMVAAVGHVGAILAEHFPKTAGNPNELPDRLIEL
ncbi:TPM domain-containing protein [Novosphingopyxis sp.]|uniref:TPM domain-containing protein n=1 Tax=Novosphingopyxis sp. TaxID=2709690 RepID=UPI003B5CCC78